MIPRLAFIAVCLCVSLYAQLPSQVGQWSAPKDWGFVATDMTVLPNGKVLAWSQGTTGVASTSPRIYNPTTDTVAVTTQNNSTNLYCSGHVVNHSGKLFALGGNLSAGTANTNLFDYRSGLWAPADPSSGARACPTALTIPSGDVIGSGGPGTNALDIWRGTVRRTQFANFNGSAGWQYWLADGRLVTASSTIDGYLRHGSIDTNVFYLCAAGFRTTGSSALFDVAGGKLLLVGGGSLNTIQNATVEVLPTAGLTPSSCPTSTFSNMAAARFAPNATILADGKVLITGGSSTSTVAYAGKVLAAEMFNPGNNAVTGMASMQVGRLRDSSAVLLPDGRVLVAGGIDDSGSHTDYEIFSPPYVFDPNRPTIVSAPARIGYLGRFTAQTGSSTLINGAALIGLSSTSNGYNAGQRYIALSASGVGTVTIDAPFNENYCPPGYYILVLMSNGVPSPGQIIQVEPRDRIGAFNPSTASWSLRLSNTAGSSDIAMSWGGPGDTPIVGDWNGDKSTTIGVHRGNTFYLRNTNSGGGVDSSFVFGDAADIPVVGDWDGTGYSKIGVYKPSLNRFDLRLSNTAGPADISVTYGGAGDVPVVGDWDGNGTTTIGVFRPSDKKFYLRNSNTPGAADLTIPTNAVINQFIQDVPIVGDWDGDGKTDVGWYRDSEAKFFLQTQNASSAIVVFGTPNQGQIPVVGDWDGRRNPTNGTTLPVGNIESWINKLESTANPPHVYDVGQSGLVKISGWAADVEEGVNLQRVEVYAVGGPNGYNFLGNATLGLQRSDVPLAFPDHPEWEYSGWTLEWRANLPVGTYQIAAAAFDTTSAMPHYTWLPAAQTTALTITANNVPFGGLDVLEDPNTHSRSIPRGGTLRIAGWAADREDGVNIARIGLSLVRSGNNAVTNLQDATLRVGQRTDVVSAFNRPDYLNSAFELIWTIPAGQATGTYTIYANAQDSQGAIGGIAVNVGTIQIY